MLQRRLCQVLIAAAPSSIRPHPLRQGPFNACTTRITLLPWLAARPLSGRPQVLILPPPPYPALAATLAPSSCLPPSAPRRPPEQPQPGIARDSAPVAGTGPALQDGVE